MRAAVDAFEGWAALGPEGRLPHLLRLAELIDRDVERIAPVEVRGHGDAARVAEAARDRSRALATTAPMPSSRASYAERVWSLERDDEPGDPHARGPGRRDHPMERALHALDLEDGASIGGRLHRGAEAGRVVAARLLAAR